MYDPEPQTLGNYLIYAVNDYNKKFTCHFELNLISFTGQVLNTSYVEKTVQPMSQVQVVRVFVSEEELRQLRDVYREAVMRVEMKCIEKMSSVYNFFFTSMKNRSVVDPGLSFEYLKVNKSVRVSAKNLATYVWVYSYIPGKDKHYALKNIEDNYFTLLPGESRTVGLGEFEAEAEAEAGIAVTCYEIEAIKEIKETEKVKKEGKVSEIEEIDE